MEKKVKVNMDRDNIVIIADKSNFHIRWENHDFGMMSGQPVSTVYFRSRKAASEWFKLNLLLLDSLSKRMRILIDAAEKDNWEFCLEIDRGKEK